MIRVAAVDFDGCLCENAFPGIGRTRLNVIEAVQTLKARGWAIILHTCREGQLLEDALNWCKAMDVPIDLVNESHPDWIAHFGGDSRKVGATIYIDDRAVTPEQLVLMGGVL